MVNLRRHLRLDEQREQRQSFRSVTDSDRRSIHGQAKTVHKQNQISSTRPGLSRDSQIFE